MVRARARMRPKVAHIPSKPTLQQSARACACLRACVESAGARDRCLLVRARRNKVEALAKVKHCSTLRKERTVCTRTRAGL